MQSTRPVFTLVGILWIVGACSQSRSPAAPTPPARMVASPLVQTPSTDSKITRVAAGNGQVCLLRASGAVECWGDNFRAQLGLGHRDPVQGRAVVPDLGKVVSLEVSTEGTCVLNQAGVVKCWDTGRKIFGKGPTKVELGAPARLLTVEESDACAALGSGEVKCWKLSSKESEVNVVGGIPSDAVAFASMAGNPRIDCYVDSQGKMECSPTEWCKVAPDSEPCLSHKTSLQGVALLDSGGGGVCAALKTGDVLCWGRFGGGRGPGRQGVELETPTKLPELAGASHVSVTQTGACAITGNRRVCASVPGLRSWTRETELPKGEEWLSMEPGGPSCAVSKSGKVACVGTNSFGQFLANAPSTGDRPAPVQSIAGAATLSMGENGACILNKQGALACWAGSWPKRGAASNPLPDHQGLVDVTVASVSDESFGCATTKDGDVYCFGQNSGPASPYAGHFKKETVQLKRLSNIVDAETTTSYSCVRERDGRVQCWGTTHTRAFNFGKHAKGDGYIPEFKDAVQLEVNGDFVCAVMKSGELRCWGERETWPDTPHKVEGLSKVVEFKSHFRSACARHEDGSVSCFSMGDSGSARPDAADNAFQANKPRLVPGITDAVSIAVGAEFACAAKADGSVSCWGDCRIDPRVREVPYGEVCRQGPKKVEGLAKVIEVRADADRYCAVTKEGQVLCAGEVRNFLLEEATVDFKKPSLLPLE